MVYHCFTVMGYGKKIDYTSAKQIDLDEIYDKLICPSIGEFNNVKNIRGDEISSTEIIDTDMFELLLSADIVLSDITTLNPNAIYELGIRHALKPYSTIIMSSEDTILPFDFNHQRIFRYSIDDLHKTEKLNVKKEQLKKLIKSTLRNLDNGTELNDSPFYEYVKYIDAPTLPTDKIEQIRDKLYGSETLKELKDQANNFIHADRFFDAASVYEMLAKNNPHNSYYLQQQALFLSKSSGENYDKNLKKAETVIKKLDPFNSLDSETTGIYGAIEKRLYELTQNNIKLQNAITSYNRSFVLNHSYYNGENVVNCLIYKLLQCQDPEELIYLKYEIINLNKKVLKIVEQEYTRQKLEGSSTDYWIYATISLSYLIENDTTNYQQYKQEFEDNCTENWEMETFKKTEELRQRANNLLKKITLNN